ncbi:MAG: GtrA family protein [Clostridia bacterium]|nr:GtrA family protein [Clostridia bacterium]
MNAVKRLVEKYREPIAYVLVGGLTTLVNIVAFKVNRALGLPTAVANALALLLSILFAYYPNRIWVFHSQQRGRAQWKEFTLFLSSRIATAVLDEAIVVFGVDVLGSRLVSESGMDLWESGVKLFATVLVIIVNYVFSKLMIFKKKD